MPIAYVTHGGGPLPLLGDPAHASLVTFLQALPKHYPRPEAIVIASAHWEERFPTLTSAANPPLIYDYGGFPPESYTIQYPAPGLPTLAAEIQRLLVDNGFEARLDERRGYDHGMFVPLKLMYPDADIPCVQLSLLESLDPEEHWRMGEALAPLLHQQNVLLVGSGSSFHNMRAMLGALDAKSQSVVFNDWLIDTCTNPSLDADTRRQRLVDWESAPYGRFCHPREEHLLPLHVCAGAAGGRAGETVYNDDLFGLAMSGFFWNDNLR